MQKTGHIAANATAADTSHGVGELRNRPHLQFELLELGEPSVPDRDLEPISPELILVSPPEIARRARQLLPEFPNVYAVDSAAPESITDAAPCVLGFPLVEVPAPRKRKMSRAAAAGIVVAVASGAGGFVAGKYLDNAVRPGQARIAAQVLPKSPVVPARNASSTSASKRVVRTAHPRAFSSARPVRSKAPRRNKPKVTRAPRVKRALPLRSVPSAKKTRSAKNGPSRANTAATFVPSRVFTWAAERGATSYIVRFFRNGKKVIQARSAKPHLTLPASFRFAAGRYRWEVLPVAGRSANPRYGAPIVESTFVLTAATAAQADS